jgi:hypothetical protein
MKSLLEQLKSKEDLGVPCITDSYVFDGVSTYDKILCERPSNHYTKENLIGKETLTKLSNKQNLNKKEIYQISCLFSLNEAFNINCPSSLNQFYSLLQELNDLILFLPFESQKKLFSKIQKKIGSDLEVAYRLFQNKMISFESILKIIKFMVSVKCIYSNLCQFSHIIGFFSQMNWNVLESLLSPNSNLSSDSLLAVNPVADNFMLHQVLISKEDIEDIVEELQNNITLTLMEEDNFKNLSSLNMKKIQDNLTVLKFLYELNLKLQVKQRLPLTEFLNSFLCDDFNFKLILIRHLKDRILNQGELKEYKHLFAKLNILKSDLDIMKYIFLFSTERKSEILQYENSLHKSSHLRHGLFSMFMSNAGHSLNIKVTRDNLLDNALTQLAQKTNPKKLRLPLNVEFIGEPGMDEGGLTKEFFNLVCQQLFSPDFGMFIHQNNYLWFNKDSIEGNLNFELIGIIMGLAIYNKVLLDIKFPLALYKKLILDLRMKQNFPVIRSDKLNLEDLKDVDPELFHSLKNTLDLDLVPDNELGLTFEISYSSWGETKFHNLIEDGHKVKLTNKNKQLFVEKYVEWYFINCIEKQYKPFAFGFLKVMENSVLHLFTSEDLLMIICGKTDLDFKELEKGSRYLDGYTADSNIIKMFWKIVHEEFTQKDKRSFLKFCTGNDRAPLRGLATIKLKISRYS